MAGEIGDRRIPHTRGLEPELRRRRLLAARRFAWGSVPRQAIMLGQWDAGEVVRLGLNVKEAADARPRSRKKRTKPPRGREE